MIYDLCIYIGKDQLDRDYTLQEFKTGIKTVMIATSVAGRGLDVPEIVVVINYSCPNHYEDYVHRVGRTGRAGRKGTAYTFISPQEEQYASIGVKALENQYKQLYAATISASGDADGMHIESAPETYIPHELLLMANNFKQKVDRGEAQYSSSGFVGKGYTFDGTELNEAQQLVNLQRREYNIEQGMYKCVIYKDVIVLYE